MDREYIENEQFKLFVESAERMSEKRMNSNNFLITVNIAYIGFLATVSLDALFLYVLGIAICIVWMLMNENYKKRNEIKYKIINEYEKERHKFFSKEYEKTKHMCNLSLYENIIIIMFIIMYVLIYITKANLLLGIAHKQ